MFLYVFLCAGDRVRERFCAPVRETEYVTLKNAGFIFFSVLVCLNLLLFSILVCTACSVYVCVSVRVRTLLDSLILSLYGEWQPQPFKSAPFGA